MAWALDGPAGTIRIAAARGFFTFVSLPLRLGEWGWEWGERVSAGDSYWIWNIAVDMYIELYIYIDIRF